MTYNEIQDGGVAEVCAVWVLSSFHLFRYSPAGRVESYSGSRQTIIVGPYYNLIPYASRSRRRRRREGGNVGMGIPSPSD